MQASKHTSEGSTLDLKLRIDATRNLKEGCQWPHKNIDILEKLFEKIPSSSEKFQMT